MDNWYLVSIPIIAFILLIIAIFSGVKKVGLLLDLNNKKVMENVNSELGDKFNNINTTLNTSMINFMESVNNSSSNNINSVFDLMDKSFKNNSEYLKGHIDDIRKQTIETLDSISKNVNSRVDVGFEKTNTTFNQISEKIAILNDAQEKIDSLSGNVIKLENVLSNKQSRGAFGEVQLEKIVSDVFPNKQYSMQQKLSNNSRVDCALNMPDGIVLAIDSKYPLESYQKLIKNDITEKERDTATKQFKTDIKKHIEDISRKYIIPNETSEVAIMFIPAESVFFELQNNHFDLIQLAQSKKVIIVSPTTLMSVLITTYGLVKDDIMKKEIGKIKEIIVNLGKDGERLGSRMEQIKTRAKQMSEEITLADTSLYKIVGKIKKIQNMEANDIEE
jgi:DNA recombination protein RmuC